MKQDIKRTRILWTRNSLKRNLNEQRSSNSKLIICKKWSFECKTSNRSKIGNENFDFKKSRISKRMMRNKLKSWSYSWKKKEEKGQNQSNGLLDKGTIFNKIWKQSSNWDTCLRFDELSDVTLLITHISKYFTMKL